ncbi:MAG: hypothetical protein U0411_00255 [Thermodesulfovibrionales bacterium]
MKTSGSAARTRRSASPSPRKSGTSTSTRAAGSRLLTARIVEANCAAPPSGRSSRVTEVTTTYRRPSSAAASATRSGSWGSTAAGAPEETEQKEHSRVQRSPRIMKAAVGFAKQTPWLGHRASSQTVASPWLLSRFLVEWRPVAFVLIHPGKRIE